jgi:hypothetical protein
MPNKMDSFDIPDISSDLIHNKDHSISEKKKKKEDESGFDIPDVESDIISIEDGKKEISQIPEVKADIEAAKYMSGEIEPTAAPAQEKPRQEQFSLTPALGSGIPSLEKDIIKTEQAHEQPVRDIADDFGDQLEKTGPWATELPFVRKIAGDLSAEQREKLIERHKWVYGMLSPEQQDQYFAENKHSSPYNFESAKKDVGSFMQWVGTTGKAAVDVGLDFTAAYLTEPLKAAIENVPQNDRVKLAKEVLDADIRNVTGAIPNTLTESYRMLKKYYGAKTFSDLTERMGDSALNPDPVSLLPQLAGIFSLPTMIASMGRLNDPDAGGVAAIDNINTWITKDETTAKKHFKNRMESEAEDSANDWKTRQGSEKLSPWSQWMYSPFGQGVMLEREKSLLPSPEVYAATYGITEAEAAGRIEAIAEKNADYNSRDIAQKWNNEFDQAKQDFGGFVTGPMGMGPGGLALGAIGLAKKLGGAMEGIGLSDEAYNAYMRAKQARTIKATENSIEEAQKPRFYESGADYIVGQQAAAADWAKGMLESIPEGARPFLPVALKYAGLGGVGGAAGALVDPESPGMGALKGAGVLAGLGLAPRVVSDLGKARRAIGGGEGGVFKTAGQAPESAWATQKLFGGKTGAVADYLTENIGPLAKAGVHLGTLNLAMGTINSDTPSELISSTMQGMMMGSGFHSLGGGFRLLHEKPMREQMEDRKKRDVEIYHAVKSASPETQQQLNRIGDFENAINRSKLNTLMMEAKLQDALQSGDKKKVDEAQKAVNVARAIQKSMLRANLQTRSEYGRNLRSLYADIHALANGARSGQGRLKIEVLTRDQIFDRINAENDANNYGKTPEQMWQESGMPGRYSKSKGTAIINADNIMRRQTLFGESPTQALRHEGFGHGLYNIPEFRKMNQAAERLLFDQQERALNGDIIKQSKGRYSDDDLISMYMNNYLKGSDVEKIQYARDMGLWDEANNTLNREATVQYMKEEVIAELNAGNLKYGLGALKKQGGAIEQWLEHNKDRNMVASALSSLTGMGAKPIYSELLETEFSPEVVAANREALKSLSKYNGRFEESTEEQSGTELPEKVLSSDSALRTRYSLNGGEYKTQMVAEVRDKNGNLVGRPLPVGDNAAEGSWVHDENTNTIQRTRGYGQLQESAAIQVPLGGKVTVKRDFVYEPDGITPIRNSDKDINTLESNRVEAIRQALETDDRFGGQGLIPVSADGESYSGMLSPKQRKAIEDLPESIVPLSMKEKIFELNDALAMDDGSTFDIDYAPRLQGKKYKGRRAEIYGMIPVNWGLSKAGNFYIRSVSLGALFRKVKARKKLLPGWYEPWGGSTEAFMDEFRNTYLKNTKEGKPGWMGLDPSKPTEQTPLATLKQNKFNDMLNLANRPREITPRDPDKRKSKAGEVDTLWRSFRVDAIADMLNTPERKYPFDAKRVYENLMPREVSEELTPRDIERETGKNIDFAIPPEEEAAKTALYENKRPQFGAARTLKEGHPVSLRIDIPAYKRGTYVVTVHEQSGSKGGVGSVVGYDTHARVYDPVFSSDERLAGKVAAGGSKTPLATVMGDFNPSREIPADIESWTPIGFDPKEHSFFYDKATDRPVIGGDEAYSVGNTVFVKNPVYGEKSDFAYMPREVAERDDAHRKAIDSGDMETAQRMVDEEAARKGYETKAYHGTDAEKIDVFDKDMFGESTGQGDIGDGFYFATTPEFASEFGKNVMPVYLQKGKYATNKDLLDPDIQSAIDDDMGFKSVAEVLAEKGFDGIKYDRGNNRVEMVVFDNNKVKSADPITRDDAGNVIPLSQRFNPEKNDIRYQPREVQEKLGAEEDQEPMGYKIPTIQANIPESVDNAATLENAFTIAGGQKWQKGRDLKVALQQNVKTEAAKSGVDVSVPSPQTTEYLVRVGKKDALVALKQNANAIGWYDIKTRLAIRIMSLMHPEIMTDENARLAFTWALATTSNGLKVGKNFQLAERAYRKYKETGIMPNDIGTGTAKAAINESLDLFNKLSKEWGTDNLRQFMQTPFSVAEIAAIDKSLKPGGEHSPTVVKGSAILGPKIGNGFFSNLYGNFDALTMDRWLVRTWGRWTGTLIESDPINTENQRNRLQAAVQAMTPEQAASMSELVGKDVVSTPTDELAVAIQKASMKPEKREQMPDEFRLSGNGLAKYLDGQKEAPAGPHERTYIRSVFSQILDELHQIPEYKDLTMADLQAVLWYGEKRLYETAKVKIDDENDPEGYSDEEAPDYANAAAEVALANGISQRKLNNAIALENGRTTNTQSGVQGTDQPGEQAASGAFTPSKKRSFVQTRAIARVRSNRSGDEEQSFSYSRGSGGGGQRTRVLKSLGVRYVDEFKGGAGLKRVLKNNGVDAPSYLEIDNSDSASVQKFADMIQESKESSQWGSSVYVYPNEDYANMRLLIAKDGKSGAAVKKDGDIVSVFSHSDSKAGRAVLEAAIAAGGTKLDCFDTVLPSYYAAHGFKAVSRLKWDDSQAPENWDKSVYGKHNNGEPDVVFMAYDPSYYGTYSIKDGKIAESYDQALEIQKRAVNKLKKASQ